jgi:hypothetical protein
MILQCSAIWRDGGFVPHVAHWLVRTRRPEQFGPRASVERNGQFWRRAALIKAISAIPPPATRLSSGQILDHGFTMKGVERADCPYAVCT